MLRLLPGISSLLISTRPLHSPAFFKNTSRFFPMLAVADTSSCAGPQNTIGHPAGCRFRVERLRNRNRLKKHDLWYDDLWKEKLGDRVKFVFSPDVTLWLTGLKAATDWLTDWLTDLTSGAEHSLSLRRVNSTLVTNDRFISLCSKESHFFTSF